MSRLNGYACVAGAFLLMVAGCGQVPSSGTTAAEQLQTFVSDFLLNALAAYLI